MAHKILLDYRPAIMYALSVFVEDREDPNHNDDDDDDDDEDDKQSFINYFRPQ